MLILSVHVRWKLRTFFPLEAALAGSVLLSRVFSPSETTVVYEKRRRTFSSWFAQGQTLILPFLRSWLLGDETNELIERNYEDDDVELDEEENDER